MKLLKLILGILLHVVYIPAKLISFTLGTFYAVLEFGFVEGKAFGNSRIQKVIKFFKR